MLRDNKGIYDSLIDSRIIFINGEIDADMANSIIAQLLYLDSLNNEDINIYINSGGGSVLDGLAIIDTMKFIKSKVNTVAIGTVASMAAVILASGNRRYSLEHSKMMIHQVYFGVQGTMSDVSIAYENVLDIKKTLMSLLAKACHKSISKLEKDCDRDYWMNASVALDYGLIDEIL